jgi:hypothetical protein
LFLCIYYLFIFYLFFIWLVKFKLFFFGGGIIIILTLLLFYCFIILLFFYFFYLIYIFLNYIFLKFFFSFYAGLLKYKHGAGYSLIEFEFLGRNIMFPHFFSVDVSILGKQMDENYDPVQEAIDAERLEDEATDSALRARRTALNKKQEEMFSDPFMVYENLENPEYPFEPCIETYYAHLDEQQKLLGKLQNDQRRADFLDEDGEMELNSKNKLDPDTEEESKIKLAQYQLFKNMSLYRNYLDDYAYYFDYKLFGQTEFV